MSIRRRIPFVGERHLYIALLETNRGNLGLRKCCCRYGFGQGQGDRLVQSGRHLLVNYLSVSACIIQLRGFVFEPIKKSRLTIYGSVILFCSERRSSYSVCVKQLFFLKLGAPYKAIQLDEESKYQHSSPFKFIQIV